MGPKKSYQGEISHDIAIIGIEGRYQIFQCGGLSIHQSFISSGISLHPCIINCVLVSRDQVLCILFGALNLFLILIRFFQMCLDQFFVDSTFECDVKTDPSEHNVSDCDCFTEILDQVRIEMGLHCSSDRHARCEILRGIELHCGLLEQSE